MRIAQFYLGASLLPVANGLRRACRLDTSQRVLLSWLTIAVLLNYVEWAIGSRGHQTLWLQHLSYPGYGALGLEMLGRFANEARLLRMARLGGLAYLAVWTALMFTLEDGSAFSGYAGPILWFMLSAASAGLLMRHIRSRTEVAFRDPVLLTGVATLLSYAPAIALEPLSKALYAQQPGLVLALWESRAALLIIGAFLYAFALQWEQSPLS